MASTEFVITVMLPFGLTKRRKHYLASCPILDVHSQGDTSEKAKSNLVEALSLFLISCLERNTLDAVLKECGFKVASISQTAKTPRQQKYLTVPIPFHASHSPYYHAAPNAC